MDCKMCEETCETFSTTRESRARGETEIGCTRCMDICPNGATYYRLIGTEIGVCLIFVVLKTPNK